MTKYQALAVEVKPVISDADNVNMASMGLGPPRSLAHARIGSANRESLNPRARARAWRVKWCGHSIRSDESLVARARRCHFVV
jgi:hypothetical protein